MSVIRFFGTFITILLLQLSISSAASAVEPLEELGLYRWVEKGARYGYVGMFPRYVMVRSRAQLDTIRREIDADTPSMIKERAADQFKSIFDKPKIDFDTESLVLLCLAVQSGSFRISTGSPTFDGDTLWVPVEILRPPIGTADMAYYVYALAVKKSVVNAVRLQVGVKDE